MDPAERKASIRDTIAKILCSTYGAPRPLAGHEHLDSLPDWAEIDFADIAHSLQREFGFQASDEEWRRFLGPEESPTAPTLDALTDFVFARETPANAHLFAGDTYRPLRLIVFSIAAGLTLGSLAYAIMLPFYDFLGLRGLLLAAAFGLVIGLCCSPFVVLLLWTRNVPATRPLVLWPVALLTAIVAYFMDENAIFALMPLAAAAFIAACILARLIIPRTWNIPRRCRFCAYDLRGSLEFGRCPECGHSFDEQPWFARRTGQSRLSIPKRTAAFFIRHPVLPILAIVAVLLLPRACFNERRARREAALSAALTAACESGEPWQMCAHTLFAWDTMYIIPPYCPRSDVETALGFAWPEYERTDIERNECINLLVFVHDGAVTEFLRIHRGTDFAAETHLRPWPADQAMFEAHALDGARCEVRPVNPASHPSTQSDPP